MRLLRGPSPIVVPEDEDASHPPPLVSPPTSPPLASVKTFFSEAPIKPKRSPPLPSQAPPHHLPPLPAPAEKAAAPAETPAWRKHSRLAIVLQKLWSAICWEMPDDAVPDRLSFEAYCSTHAALFKALRVVWDPQQARKLAEADFRTDSKGKGSVARDSFLSLMYTLSARWTVAASNAAGGHQAEAEPDACSFFLETLLRAVSTYDRQRGVLRLKPLDEIDVGAGNPYVAQQPQPHTQPQPQSQSPQRRYSHPASSAEVGGERSASEVRSRRGSVGSSELQDEAERGDYARRLRQSMRSRSVDMGDELRRLAIFNALRKRAPGA
eukprot:tig00021682_g23094.t1